MTDGAKRERVLTTGETESWYGRLTGYGFATRYVGGKDVLDVCWDGAGYGARVMAGVAGSVQGVAISRGGSDVAPVTDAVYREAEFPGLPYPADRFDVVIALEVIEHLENPEEFLAEAKRILKRDGLLILSTPDRQAHSNERDLAAPEHGRELHVPELRGMLESRFDLVRLHRLGAISGGAVFPEARDGAPVVETYRLSSASPLAESEELATRFVLAVCGDAGCEDPDFGRPYLMLDRDRSLLDEREELARNVELLREEILHMQETEVQAFRDELQVFQDRAQVFQDRAQVLQDRARMLQEALKLHKDRVADLEARVRALEGSFAWRVFAPYRRLRAMFSKDTR